MPYPPVELYTGSSGTGRENSLNTAMVPSLKRMKNKDILLTLPGTMKIRDIKWLAVWCMRFTVNYGEIYIPEDLKIPEKVVSILTVISGC